MKKTFLFTAVVLLIVSISACFHSGRRGQSVQAPQRVIRFAHFTDIHMEPKQNAPEGLAQALRHMQALEDRPTLLVTGGDHVMDSFGAKEPWVTTEFDTLKKVLKENCTIPIKYCIGNHDSWGWDKKSSETTGQEPYWGKQRPVHEFGMPGRYYGFSQSNWHFIILDSTHTADDNYQARLDPEQFAWLQNELAAHKDQYIVIISHIPILSVAAYLDGENEKDGRWSLPKEWMHLDARQMKDLFAQYPNVRLCISGHLHLVDRAEYNGVTYICDGAVCAAWWGGNHMECDEGYGVFDLYSDGTFAHQYLSYGWEVAPK
jgi:Icc protein